MPKPSIQCSDEAKIIFKDAAERMDKPLWKVIDIAARAFRDQAAREESAADQALRMQEAMSASARQASNTNKNGVRQVSDTTAAAS